MENNRLAEVLLVEDNEDDVLITRRGFDIEALEVNVHHVENGELCMAFLRKEGDYADAPTPDLILLDLNMPVMDGREVLSEIVTDPTLRAIPVVILTTSDADTDLAQMYQLRCSTYIVKPADFQQFRRILRLLIEYWFGLATLPPKL